MRVQAIEKSFTECPIALTEFDFKSSFIMQSSVQLALMFLLGTLVMHP